MLCKQGNCNIFRYLSKKGLVGPRGRGVKDITKIGRKILREVREVEDWGPGLFNTQKKCLKKLHFWWPMASLTCCKVYFAFYHVHQSLEFFLISLSQSNIT